MFYGAKCPEAQEEATVTQWPRAYWALAWTLLCSVPLATVHATSDNITLISFGDLTFFRCRSLCGTGNPGDWAAVAVEQGRVWRCSHRGAPRAALLPICCQDEAPDTCDSNKDPFPPLRLSWFQWLAPKPLPRAAAAVSVVVCSVCGTCSPGVEWAKGHLCVLSGRSL